MNIYDKQFDSTGQLNPPSLGRRNQIVVLFSVVLAVVLAAPTISFFIKPSSGSTKQPSYELIQSNCSSSATMSGMAVGEGDGYRGITAVSNQDVWVVGVTHASIGPIELSKEQGLIQHWDGINWHFYSIMNTFNGESFYLRSVAANSDNDVWAVGQSYTSSPYNSQILIVHWDGKQWHIVPHTNISLSGSRLNAVAVNVEGGVWAVGSYLNSNSESRPVVMQWDGVRWNISNPGMDIEGELFGVASLYQNDVWTAGYYELDGRTQPLLLHWDGVKWQLKVIPHVEDDVILHSIAPISENNVWVAGSSKSGGVTFYWNGMMWADIPSPISKTPSSSVNGLVAVNESSVWAVGSNQNSSTPIVLHWNGREWVDISNPSLKRGQAFFDVAKSSQGDIWAAGHSFSDEDGQNGLIAHFTSNPCAAATSITMSTP